MLIYTVFFLLTPEVDENKHLCSRSYTVIFKLEALAKFDELNGNISTTAKVFVFFILAFKIGIKREKNWQMLQDEMQKQVKNECNILSDNEQRKKQRKFPEMENAVGNQNQKERKAD